MFISIPKEFFVPVIFSDGFILNQENYHLELDTNLYRKSSESEKYSEIEISKKVNLDEILNVNNELNNFNDSTLDEFDTKGLKDITSMFGKRNNDFDENSYRESTAKIINQSINKNLENSKYESEKENIIAKVEMNNKNYINKDEGVSNKKQNDDIYKACKYSGKIFNEIDDEIIENMDIEGCNKNK